MRSPTLDTYDAVSRFFPSRDKRQALDLLRWLDHCGYKVVRKHVIDEAPLVPAETGETRFSVAHER